ncbi:MAG: hypothetical protein ACYDBH_01620 [Acidobacteriaceae bacterium]
MSKLTMRSKIAVRWTTNPGDMGYDGSPSEWRSKSPQMCSVRRAEKFSRELAAQIGQGTYRLISYKHRGREVDVGELQDIVSDAEYAKYVRRA